MTAAAVQGMPIREKGLHVDLHGHGCAMYFERPLSDLGMTLLDMKERKLTMIALYSAHAAQLRFYPECLQNGWRNDLDKIRGLSRQMHPTDEEAHITLQRDLHERAKKLVDDHWLIVEELARALLAKSPTPMSQEEINEAWGIGPPRTTHERLRDR